jgi:lipopolysaccharide export system protein LptA
VGRANAASGRIVGLLKTIGASAIALALCTSVPIGALAQSSSDSPGAATAQNTPSAALGASIRKTPGAAAAGGAPAAANSPAAAPAGTDGAQAPSVPADGSAASDASATASVAAPGAMESVGAPAALATPSAHAKAKAGTKTKTKTRARRGADSSDATQSASAKTDSKDTSEGSKDSKDSKDSPFSSLQFSGNKGPIDIKSDALDLDYKGNVVTFRGHVRAAQADALLTSDTLTVIYGKDFHEVKEMVANNNVRMSQGTRWATGDHAVLDQAKHTVTLTGSPVVHDGEDQVTGSKITVHLDTGKSEVEGARAVFFPKEQKTRDNKTTVAKSP